MRLPKLVAALAAATIGTSAQAAFITGSIGVNPSSTTTNPTAGQLSDVTSFTFGAGTTSSATLDFLTAVGNGTATSISTLAFTGSTAGSTLAGTTTISFGAGKTVTITGGTVLLNSGSNPGFYNASLTGVANITGYDPTAVTIGYTANEVGGSVTSSFTIGSLNAPPPPVLAVPAPPTAFALLSALPALAVLRRVRRLAAA
jgi:hypothetical protein